MIMAAGKGERMLPLTKHTPKPLLCIANKPLIIYHIEALQRVGIEDIVINVSHLAQSFYKVLQDGKSLGVRLHYSFEPEPLGWTGGIVKALPLLGRQSFIVISADIFTDFPYHRLLACQNTDFGHCVLVDNPSHHPQGDYGLEEHTLTPKGEKNYNYAGIGVFTPNIFNKLLIKECEFSALLNPLIAQKKISGEYYQGIWHNVGTIAQLSTLNQLFTKNPQAT